MNQIHTSYKTSKMLKEFLGDGSVEPIIPAYYYEDKKGFGISATREYSGSPAAYQLHDLLSKPFANAFVKEVNKRMEKTPEGYTRGYFQPGFVNDMASLYYEFGLPRVEAALMEMMEGR